MPRKIYFICILALLAFSLSGCGMSLSGPGGPDSGEEIDPSEESKGPDSGEDYDTSIPGAPDSGEEIDTSDEPKGPDSGDEVDPNEPTSPDSGDEIDTSEPTSPDSGEDYDTSIPGAPDSGDEIDTSDEPKSPDSGEEADPNEPTSPDSGDEITLNEDLKNRAKGSCNLISEGSTCIEYIGSYWTKINARLNCSSAAAFSTTPCPRPALGGCNVGAGSATEIVTWHYGYGGDPYTEVINYAASACNALPSAHWIN
jgi:hypothetical protein